MKQNPYKRFARALAAVEKWIIVVALAIGVALTAVNVVCRYIFKANVNFSWSEEVVVALLVLTYMVGAALCFWIARVVGREAVEKLAGKNGIRQMEEFFQRHGTQSVLIARLLPFVSFDWVSYFAGLTSMRFWSFFLAPG